MQSNVSQPHLQKAFNFLIIFTVTMFLNRVFSTYFSPSAASIFTFFAGGLINYTALFFIFLIISLKNFRKAFSDERIKAAMDILLVFTGIFIFFLIAFPAKSIKLSFIHFPVTEFFLIGLISFLCVFTKQNKSIIFHKKLVWRIFLLFILPYSVLTYIKYPPRIILYSIFGKNYPVYFTILFIISVLITLITQIFNKNKKIFLPFVSNAFFVYSAFLIYFVFIPATQLVNIQRYAFALFYVVLFPVIFMLDRQLSDKENSTNINFDFI